METYKYLFDLHCDTIYEGERLGSGLVNDNLQFSLDRLPEDYRLCQCMALFMPDRYRGEEAEQLFDRLYRYYLSQITAYSAVVNHVERPADIAKLLEEKQFALMLTVEGGSALAGKLERVQELHDLGVKMMTLTWNAANEICGGCATEEGFTPFGQEVIKEMECLGMVVDVSHLSDKGFWQLCEMAERPFAASHSNSRAVCDHRRNLTDDMFREIVRRGGLVGMNYYTEFISSDAQSATVEDLVRHVLHFLELGGEDVVALGSDMDGAEEIVKGLDGLEHLPSLFGYFEKAGIPRTVIDKITFGNARRFFAGN